MECINKNRPPGAGARELPIHGRVDGKGAVVLDRQGDAKGPDPGEAVVVFPNDPRQA
jgi:hypothetical protein